MLARTGPRLRGSLHLVAGERRGRCSGCGAGAPRDEPGGGATDRVRAVRWRLDPRPCRLGAFGAGGQHLGLPRGAAFLAGLLPPAMNLVQSRHRHRGQVQKAAHCPRQGVAVREGGPAGGAAGAARGHGGASPSGVAPGAPAALLALPGPASPASGRVLR